MKRCLFLLPLLLFIGSRPFTAVAQAIPLSNYWQQIADLQELIGRIQDEPVLTQQVQLAAAAAHLAPVTAVSLPNGRQIPISHTSLLNELTREPPDLERLQNILTAWQRANHTWPQTQFDDIDQQSLQAILQRPEFNYETASQPTWLDNLRERFWRWLLNLLPENVSFEVANIVNWFITILGAIGLAILLFYALRGLLSDFASEASLSAEDDLDDLLLTADAALQRAQNLSDSGDYRTAVRYLYLSALLLLEERGLLRYNRSLTNREYLRSLAHHPELATTLQDVIEVFDRTWYGFHTLKQAEYSRYASQVAALKQQMRPGE